MEYPNGLLYESSFVTHEEEQALLAFVETLTFDAVEMRGQVARRTVRHFGVDYRFDTGAVVATEPIPDELETLRARAAAWIERDTQDLAEALVTRYPPGATIGWHRDAPAFGSRVVGISLLAPARMRFRRTTKAGSAVFDLVLEPRSGYVLGGAARASWQHSIPAVKELRYSVTFRTVRRARGADARAEES
ncbi:MAG TPA: alpha-ketoglutarate-dependent dioxygenase AlkB [Actinomycetota bacterium]|nr:alpha-ketoglutarate-dependent dioxygenase AlkB [Actinomycetota bacterium]